MKTEVDGAEATSRLSQGFVALHAGQEGTPMIAFKDLCIDAVDPSRMATFWSAVLGLRPESRRSAAPLVGERPEHTVWINPVPEPRTVKQRVHLDVHAASIEDLLALGRDRARRVAALDVDGRSRGW